MSTITNTIQYIILQSRILQRNNKTCLTSGNRGAPNIPTTSDSKAKSLFCGDPAGGSGESPICWNAIEFPPRSTTNTHSTDDGIPASVLNGVWRST